jgi:hypothetical protein
LQVDETSTNTFCDVDILLVGALEWSQEKQAEAAHLLKRLEEDSDSEKCCMEYLGDEEGNVSINDYLHGYVRLIEYVNKTNSYVNWIFEG